jgi:hypothetical protein
METDEINGLVVPKRAMNRDYMYMHWYTPEEPTQPM